MRKRHRRPINIIINERGLAAYQLERLLRMASQHKQFYRLSNLNSILEMLRASDHQKSKNPTEWGGRKYRWYNYESPNGTYYAAIYNKKTEILHITRNLRAMKENVHLRGLEVAPRTVDNLVIYVPPGATPYSMGRVRLIEDIPPYFTRETPNPKSQ